MPTSIDKILSKSNISDLCNKLVDRIIKYHGEDLDISTLPRAHRTVLLIRNTTGIIGNGGFNYLFEGNYKGDPHFSLTAQAFRDIKCSIAAEAFQKALDLFPDSKPPNDISQRLNIYRRGAGKSRYDLDSIIWEADDEIEKCLASYIRAHRKQFKVLDKKPKSRKPKEKIQESEQISPASDFGLLPHWARVAFAARCARYVLPIFHANWPNASKKYCNAVKKAITLAEKSAINASPSSGLKKAVLDATVTAGSALMALYGIPSEDNEPRPTDGNMAATAATAIKAAAKAAEAALMPAKKSEMPAMEAYSYAQDAAGADQELIAQMYVELALLIQVAVKAKWKHKTPVPRKLFALIAETSIKLKEEL